MQDRKECLYVKKNIQTNIVQTDILCSFVLMSKKICSCV